MKRFNTTGLCIPHKHYMVDITDRVAQIKAMVDAGDYFCINRGRQYGKTTTLAALKRALASEYTVASLDFQALSHADFQSEGAFTSAFARELLLRHGYGSLCLPNDIAASLKSLVAIPVEGLRLATLFYALSLWNSRNDKPVVLIVDEVDSATNNQVFLDFLAQLRLQYLTREENPDAPAFQSVILAGVTDIKHLKAKIRHDDQRKVNSPWNIAADFDVDMSFSSRDVAGMLAEYEADHSTGMDVDAVAQEVTGWTGGYPFLVSRICQLIDKHGFAWDRSGVSEAVKVLLSERNTLFESLMGKLETLPELRKMLYGILMEGRRLPYSADNEQIAQLEMYGFIRRSADNSVVLSNRIFETRLYDFFILDEKLAGNEVYERGDLGRSTYIEGGRLNMRAVLEGFRRAYVEVFGPPEDGERFCEDDGRKQFLLFLKPIINGTGNYYVEAQTRDRTRTDVIVDYAGERFVVELKIWRGPRYNEDGERQVAGYLAHFDLNVGYMLSFSFNQHKEPGLRRVVLGDKVLWEETV